MKTLVAIGAVFLLFIGSGCDSRKNDTTNPRAADNTGTNVRDRPETAITPVDQGNNPADLEITRRIREAVTSNDQLSANAKNIKIVTQNGKVTLRGPVNSEQERDTILGSANKAGASSVDNQLEVKTNAP